MDMALHLGMTEAGIRTAMSERELERWAQYSRRRMLPIRRIEMLLAQVSLMVLRAQGGAKDATLEDFLFDPAGDVSEDVDSDEEPPAIEDLAAFFGAQIVKV